MLRICFAAACSLGWAAVPLHAQRQPLHRSDVLAAALTRGPRINLSRADVEGARALVTTAQQWENPVFSYQHTKDTPREHIALDVPLVFPAQRNAAITVVRTALRAAQERLAFESAAVRYDADTTYTRALVAGARAQLSARAANDADSVVVLSTVRRDAGDASELEVELARVSAGQIRNAAALDALEATNAVLAVQAVMGLATDSLLFSPADSLEIGNDVNMPGPTMSLYAASAESDAQGADLAVSIARRRLFSAPSLSLGIDTRDPGGLGNQLLPAFGVAISLPLFNRNQGGVEAALATSSRAHASLALARIEVGVARARAQRALTVARERLRRSQLLAVSAQRVAALSLLGYQEGAAVLPLVFEAQRTSRETLFQVLDDMAAVRNGVGLLTLLNLPAMTAAQ